MTSRRLSLPALLLTVAGLVAGVLVAPPAEATSVLLCKGFTQCKDKGYSSFEYGPSNYREMWWRMYAGHNCTNYVSYRMVSRGMSATRPWSGSGDARNWGVVFSDKVDQTPLIGSIAWWSSNHVAYVQKVVDKDTIVISEDHYGGDFDWRKIVRSGGGWPTGFIHLRDEQMVTTVAPRVKTAPKVGVEVVGSHGTWNHVPTGYSFRWYADGVAIWGPGATSPRFVPGPALFGKQLSLRVVARKPNFLTGKSMSLLAPATAPGDMVANTAPTLRGPARVDGLLKATPGTWTPAAKKIAYTWRADGVDIPGANSALFHVRAAQLGKKITVVTTASTFGYADSPKESAPTAAVVRAKFTVVQSPTITGAPHPGQKLTFDAGAVSPSASRTSTTWLRDGKAIPGAHGTKYVPTVADVGHVIGAQIRYSREGYTTITKVVNMRAPVKVIPRFQVRSLSAGHVTVTVTAPGLSMVYGPLTMSHASGRSVEHRLSSGKTTFAPSWLPAHGQLTLTFFIPATSRTTAHKATLVVHIG